MAFPYYQMNYPMYQPIIPQQPSQAQASSPSGIIWVSGLQEAQMYPLAPNNAIALWEQSGKVIYLKSADATGKPTMRIYDLVERTEASATVPAESNSYATKEELGTIAGAMKTALADIEQMKADLYGVAGKRKAKREVTEDDDA